MAREIQTLLDEIARLNSQIRALAAPGQKGYHTMHATSAEIIHGLSREIDTRLAMLTVLSGR